jgi:hypothetical protein
MDEPLLDYTASGFNQGTFSVRISANYYYPRHTLTSTNKTQSGRYSSFIDKRRPKHLRSSYTDSIRKKTSASNEPMCDKYKLHFDKHSGQKLFLSFLKALQIFFISQNSFRKTRDT